MEMKLRYWVLNLILAWKETEEELVLKKALIISGKRLGHCAGMVIRVALLMPEILNLKEIWKRLSMSLEKQSFFYWKRKNGHLLLAADMRRHSVTLKVSLIF